MSQSASTPHKSTSTSASNQTTPTSQHRRTSSILTPEQQSFLEHRLQNKSLNSPNTTTEHHRNTSTQLETLLQQRNIQPDTTAVYEAGIHKDDISKVAPRLHTTKQTLQKNLTKSALHEKLSNRPTIDELQGSGIYKHKNLASTNLTPALPQPVDNVVLNAPHDTVQSLTQATNKLNINTNNTNVNNNTTTNNAELSVQQELYQRRSKMFHLTRILLRAVVALYDAKLINTVEKAALKDLIVDSHPDVLACAEQFDLTNDQDTFKTHLIQVAKLAATT